MKDTTPKPGWNDVDESRLEIERLVARVKELEAERDGAYLERNRLVAALSRLASKLGWVVGLRRTAIEGWDSDWQGCVWFDTQAGQLSWHYHDSQSHLFEGLPEYIGPEWDGHTTLEKYERLARVVVADAK